MTAASVIKRSTSLIPREIRRFLFLIQRLFNLIGWLSTAREIYLPPTRLAALFRRSHPTEAQLLILRQVSIQATWRSTQREIFSQLTELPAQSSNTVRPARERPLPVLG